MTNTISSATAQEKKQIHVMLVDDSAVIRGALSRIIESDPAIKVVSSVANGQMAITAAGNYHPHVVILDIEMPVMDGLTALPEILKVSPESKVIMFSTLTEKGADVSLKAFSLGAVECLVKPSSQGKDGDNSFEDDFLRLIKNLVDEKHRRTPEEKYSKPPPQETTSLLTADFELHNDANSYKGKPAIIAIGSSTGGPQALFEVIKSFKGFDIPIVITQHMPATFTKILAQHIEQHASVPTFEGEENMEVKSGHAYVAPGGYHMHLIQRDGRTFIHLDQSEPINFCKPSVDPMFKTAVNIYGNKVFGIILTGMGNDGLGGGQALTKAGGRLITQDEETSVVWGMPGAVAKAGICSAVLPLKEIGPWAAKAVIG